MFLVSARNEFILFACYWKALVGETPTLASRGVSAVRYDYRTMVRNTLTRASHVEGAGVGLPVIPISRGRNKEKEKTTV
jgi:hypothetical protein